MPVGALGMINARLAVGTLSATGAAWRGQPSFAFVGAPPDVREVLLGLRTTSITTRCAALLVESGNIAFTVRSDIAGSAKFGATSLAFTKAPAKFVYR